jgi:hypothetical protein
MSSRKNLESSSRLDFVLLGLEELLGS